jgi:hypothetical protein
LKVSLKLDPKDKRVTKEQIRAARNSFQYSPIEYMGITFSADEEAQRRISLICDSLTEERVRWKTSNGVVDLSMIEFKGLRRAIADRMYTAHLRSVELEENLPEVYGRDITYNAWK